MKQGEKHGVNGRQENETPTKKPKEPLIIIQQSSPPKSIYFFFFFKRKESLFIYLIVQLQERKEKH